MPLSGGVPTGSPQTSPVTVADVAEHIRITCGLPSAGPTVGAEVEWLVTDRTQSDVRPTVAAIQNLLADLSLPGGSRLTFEPGGQVELSSPPGRTPDEAHTALLADIAVLRPALRGGGFELLAAAHDSTRPPLRVSDSPRYEVMEEWFAAGGWPAAADMMCNTASIQVNVGCGADPSDTWRRANALAPLLAAMFACSPGSGWASERLRAWAGIDPSRTSSALDSGDVIADWTRYALSAKAVMRLTSDGGLAALSGGFTLREWIETPPPNCPPPCMADVALHLSTLFPPVRLKGWIEVRVIDMQPDDWWPVPLAVTAALVAPPSGNTPHVDLTWLEDISDISWQEAARTGLASTRLAVAADKGLRVARSVLQDQGSNQATLVERFRIELVEPHLSGLGDGHPLP